METSTGATEDKRCTRPSTHMRGGGYIEVECYCEEHAMAAAAKYGDKRVPRPVAGQACLDTAEGLRLDRRRCQWVEARVYYVVFGGWRPGDKGGSL